MTTKDTMEEWNSDTEAAKLTEALMAQASAYALSLVEYYEARNSDCSDRERQLRRARDTMYDMSHNLQELAMKVAEA